MVKYSSIRVWRVLCCAVVAALVSSCTDPPEMLEYQKDAEQLKTVVREFRQDVQRADDELKALRIEKRAWDKDTALGALRTEVDELKSARDAAKAQLSRVEEEFEDMKNARLP